MAEEVLKKVEEQLNCSICFETYTDPKLLQCSHVHCKVCLVKLIVRDQQGQLGITCPTCRQVTPIPDRGVAGLPPAFYINRLRDIHESFSENRVKKVNHCCVHEDEELRLYCETCGELICSNCALKGAKHHDHDYKKLDQAFEKCKGEITSSLEPMKEQVTIIKRALTRLETRYEEISDQREATKDNVHDTFQRLQEVLSSREVEVIDQLDQMTEGKLKGLTAQREQIETTLAQLNSCLDFMRESLKTGNKEDVPLMKTNVKQVKELTTPFQPDILEPNTKPDVIFSASADMTAVCQNYGQVLLAKELPDPSKCHATCYPVGPAIAGKTILQVANFEGKPCEEPIKSLQCELVSEITGTKASCNVERRGESQYEISYQPTIKGRHQLHIKAEGQHVRGSPFSVAVKSPIEKLGTPILTIEGMKTPCGVAINERGEVVVAEETEHRITVFSPCGEKLRSFGTLGSGQGELHRPYGVAVDGEGNILVADSGNYRIQRFSAEGQFLAAVGAEGHGELQFSYPIGIAVNPSNSKVYVADGDNHRVQVLNSDLTFSGTFGMKGSSEGHFDKTWGIACDSTGKVYVVDSYNHRIQVFTAEGKFLRMFGRRGQGKGELDLPNCVAIDSSDMVYVSEGASCRVSVFTSEGQFVTSFGKVEGPQDLKFPVGLAIDDSGVVYVCDWDNHRVQIF